MVPSKIQVPWSSKVSPGQLVATVLLGLIVFIVLAKLVSVPLRIDDFDTFRYRGPESDDAPLVGQGLVHSEIKP